MENISIFFIILFFVPIITFVFIGLTKYKPSNSISEFYTQSGHADESSYTQSTVAYMLQTATTFYFIYWGFHYGLGNIWYILSWMGGIYILKRYSSSISKKFCGKFTTLADFLSENKSYALKLLTALVSLIGFSAIVYVETYFGAQLGVNIVNAKPDPSSTTWWIFFLTLLLGSFIYSVYGGLKKVYFTDKIQLGVAYLGFLILFSVLSLKAFNEFPGATLIISLLIIAVIAFLAYEDIKAKEFGIKFRFLIVGGMIFLLAFFNGVFSAEISFADISIIPGFLSQAKEPYGLITLSGFIAINLGWQFCDNSNFQRIASIEGNSQNKEKAIEKAIHSTLYASPLTWAFGIFLGILIKLSAIDISAVGEEATSFITYMYSSSLNGDFFAIIGLSSFIIAISSILLSTVDTSILAVLQIWECDLSKRTETKLWFRASIALFIFLLTLVLAYWNINLKNGNIFTIINAGYSQLLTLSIPVIMKLSGVNAKPIRIIFSIILGSIATWLGVFAVPESIHYNITYVLPTFTCLIGSLIPYIDLLIAKLFKIIKK
jgi:hypothetical protein